MEYPLIPIDEDNRLKDLQSYDILDSEEENDFNELAEIAAQLCNCNSATITFIDKDRQWFKSRKNILLTEGPRNTSFCAHVILNDEIMIVPNTALDMRFSDNPDVIGGLKIGFYAGAPIISSVGYKLGTVCAIDQKPKQGLSKQQEIAMKAIANQVGKLMELRIKNKQIIENTEALVTAERKIAQLNMQAEEEEKNHIATELHENFAQNLAAVKMYLAFAESSKDLSDHFIRKSKENISYLIEEVKALSKSITPTTFQSANYVGFIEDHAREFCKKNNLELNFSSDEDTSGCDHETGLTLFRIVQSQLKIAKAGGASYIIIEIEKDKTLKLSITNDGQDMEDPDTERKLLLKNIVHRAELLNGKISMGADDESNNILNIELPVCIKKNKHYV